MDLGDVIAPDDVEAALESALRRGLSSISYLSRRIETLGTRGRKGLGILARIIEERPAGAPPTGSGFETRLHQALRKARLPYPQRQVSIFDGDELIRRVDFAYLDRKIAIEADSYEHHSSKVDWEKDRARRNRLTAMGWLVLHVTYRQLRDDPAAVVQQIGRAIGHEGFEGI